jgi:hypothetical protein
MPLPACLTFGALCLVTMASPLTRSAEAQADSTARDPRVVQPERPTVATHAGTVARGYMELEQGGEWDREEDGTHAFIAPSNLKVGLAPRAQLNLLFNLIRDRSISGKTEMSDLTVGVKYRIVDDNRILGDFAFLPAVKLPTGSSGVGTETTDFSLLLISSRQVGPVAIDLNVGQTRRTGDGTKAPKDASIWMASFGFPVTGPLGAVVEFFGYPSTRGPLGTESSTALLVGPTFLAHESLSLDAGVIVPLTGPQPRAFYTGFVWNLGCVAGRRICRE